MGRCVVVVQRSYPDARVSHAQLASTSVASRSKPHTLSFVSTWLESDYVNPGFTRRILDVTKPESNIILDFLFHQIAENVDFQPPLGAELNCVNAIFDFWPQTRYALKATPHGETSTQILGF
ncbi:hypothetical protein CY34DRAFT_804540 [Suillus luteus UH-Slu-Lm8-n1]|uniref:Uncharacterized protein n=1 Tax=Suillus luteus UH-Slu-Lm8-n1 TaxID=930992 RepID=A0A0D0B8T8_9AGAM|nr:hypothetical protein CY34DRAFT_804540 [Suillus luteus UH-Slu-Lm8-n1]